MSVTTESALNALRQESFMAQVTSFKALLHLALQISAVTAPWGRGNFGVAGGAMSLTPDRAPPDLRPMPAPFAVRPADIATYQPRGKVIAVKPWEQWLTSECEASVQVFGLAQGTYDVDGALWYPEACNGTTLWLDGVTLNFADVTQNMVSITARNVTLRGGTYQYKTLPFSQGHVSAIVSPSSFELTVSTGYPTSYWTDGNATVDFTFMDAQTRGPKVDAAYDNYAKPIVQGTTANRFVIGDVDLRHVQVGDALVTRGPYTQCLYVESGNSTLADLTMHSCNGYAVYDTGDGNNRYDNFNLVFPASNWPGTTEPPLLTSAADMFHSSATVGPTIERSRFEGGNDDGIAIQGWYEQATSYLNNTLVIENRNKNIKVNQPMRLYDSSWHYQDTFQVLAVDGDNVTLDHELPAAMDVNTWWFALLKGTNFVVRDTYVGYHRARGLLIKADGGTIEGNIITGASMMGIQVQPEMYWKEADYTWNLTIRNNLISASPVAILVDGNDGSTEGHHGFNITHNTLQGRANADAQSLVQLSDIAGMNFANNRITSLGSAKIGLSVNEVTGVSATGNCLVGPLPAGATAVQLSHTDMPKSVLPLCPPARV